MSLVFLKPPLANIFHYFKKTEFDSFILSAVKRTKREHCRFYMTQHLSRIADLRRCVAKIDGTRERFGIRASHDYLRTGIKSADALLGNGLALNDMHELRVSLSRDIGCAFGFLLGLLSNLKNSGPIIWVSEQSTTLDTGKFFPGGLEHFGLEASRLIHIRPLTLQDALWATGEACSISGLGAVIFQVKNNPQAFDLSVSRKLMLRAQTSQTPLFIVRQAGAEEASSASTRWRIKPSLSLPHQIYPKGLGNMRLILTLEKNRNGQTGQWPVAWNPQARSFEHAAQSPQSAHPELPVYPFANRPPSAAEMGKIMAVERVS